MTTRSKTIVRGALFACASFFAISFADPLLAADRAYSPEEWRTIIESHWARHEAGLYGRPLLLDRMLRVGTRGEDVARLRTHLSSLGFTARSEGEDAVFDTSLERAVRAWQTRMGLRADGVIGPISRGVLADPGSYVRPRLDAALRDGPRRIEADEIWVDIVAQRVEARRGDRVVFEGPVVVGRPATRTPRLEVPLTGITFNPSWFVPPGIFRRTMVDRLRREPNRLAAEGFVALERVDGRLVARDIPSIDWNNVDPNRFILRQNYSDVSALGRIKFEMPNAQSIFLHDTPNRGDFQLDERLYSSGCVRVGDIATLARLVLGDDVWAGREVERRMATNRTFRIDLERPIPVRLEYRIATIVGGEVVLREDIYNEIGYPRLAPGERPARMPVPAPRPTVLDDRIAVGPAAFESIVIPHSGIVFDDTLAPDTELEVLFAPQPVSEFRALTTTLPVIPEREDVMSGRVRPAPESAPLGVIPALPEAYDVPNSGPVFIDTLPQDIWPQETIVWDEAPAPAIPPPVADRLPPVEIPGAGVAPVVTQPVESAPLPAPRAPDRIVPADPIPLELRVPVPREPGRYLAPPPPPTELAPPPPPVELGPPRGITRPTEGSPPASLGNSRVEGQWIR